MNQYFGSLGGSIIYLSGIKRSEFHLTGSWTPLLLRRKTYSTSCTSGRKTQVLEDFCPGVHCTASDVENVV